MKKHLFAAGLFVILLSESVWGEVCLTIYNQNMGLVKDVREIELKKGTSKIEFTDIAEKIDPASVHLKFILNSDKCSILEQNFEYDLINHQKLLQKYLGKEIEIERRAGKDGEKKEILKGTLLSAQNGIVLQTDNKILLNPAGEIVLSKLPDGLILKPTLFWLVNSEISGKHKIEIDYITNSITWDADYVIVTSEDDKKLDLTGWVTIDNKSGALYKDAKLKLIAGDVNRLPDNQERDSIGAVQEFRKAAAAPQFQEKSFFEYHMYTLARPATVNNNEVKQIEFAAASNISCKKSYVFESMPQFRFGMNSYQQWAKTDKNYGRDSNKKVSVMIEFKNSKGSNLGLPLPKGKIRVYKEDSDKSLEFIGEDNIGHTPKDENINIKLGNAFDISAERIQTDFKCGDDWCQETFKITIRNHKEEPVEVKVVEHLYRWPNWRIVENTDKYEKKDSKTIEYILKAPQNGEKSLIYTVRYSW